MRGFIVALLLVSVHCCTAQRKTVSDTAPVTVRNFNAGKIQAYKSDPAFQYDGIKEPPLSFWNRFWNWFWSKADEIFGTPTGARMLKIIAILIASALLIFSVLKMSGMNNAGLFGKKNTGDSSDYLTLDEDIHAINFNNALQQAVDNRNFRMAVRLLYLQSLKNLADRGFIHWQLNKTNSAYVEELKNHLFQKNFYRLTLQFENNWYGDLPVNEREFSAVREQFEAFNSQLK